MKTPAPKPSSPALLWPEDYRAWSGSFRELVETAGQVLAQLEPDGKPPTERLLRYYQNQGVLGRGAKVGNRAVFGFDDLDRVVAAKGLVKQNWTLDHASALFANTTPAERASVGYAGMVYGSADTSAPPAPAWPLSGVAAASPALLSNAAPTAANQAQAIVERLLRGGLASAAHVPSPSTVLRSAAASFLPSPPDAVALPLTSVPSTRQAWTPVPWLSVYLDEAALRSAAPHERAQARQAIEDVLRRLA